MKRVLALLACAALALSLTACSGGEEAEQQSAALTPEEIYDQAVARVEESSAIDADLTVDLTVSLEGVSLSTAMTSGVQVRQVDEETYELATVMTTETMGSGTYLEEYFKDGYFYLTDGSTKLKAPFTFQEISGQIQITSPTTRDSMETLAMTEDENGNYVFAYTIPADQVDAMIRENMGSSIQELIGDTGSFTVTEMGGTCVVDPELNFLGEEVRLVMDMDISGDVITLNLQSSATYNAIGDAVTVQFPEDLDDYIEVEHDAVAEALGA